jgi:nitrogenase-associated protein
MAEVTFFTKPGCLTGIKQQELLRQAGHTLEVLSVLEHEWTADELRSFFGGHPVTEWFNPNSPRIKAGEVDPGAFDERQALEAMLADHLLIRRPLMQSGGQRRFGFDQETIHAWIGLGPTGSADFAPAGDLQSCSAAADADGQPCLEP